MFMGCRSSGLLTANTFVVVKGSAKLISVHGANESGGALTANIYDNVAGSGKEIARLHIPAGTSVEFDMHGVMCSEGITAVVPANLDITIEFA
jgi:microcystin degradation protein MlrC